MISVNVNASKAYEIVIGENILASAGKMISNVTSAKKAVVITDDIVEKLYFETVNSSLKNSNFEVLKYVIPNGEQSKNGEQYLEICEFLAENHITKSDIIVALGGGVVGDLSGFVAATFLRGISFVQIPTTLLAAVDSSVGGKTAIDLKSGKNLVGSFYQPKLVICDYLTLNTLEKNIFVDGCAEVIKYAVIGNKKLFNHLVKNGLDFDREYVISECVKMKRDIVEKDEFDKGERQKLNLGHTVGHSIEACSNFKISHGSAVAIGLAIISRAALKKGICDKKNVDDILNVLKEFDLPIDTEFSADDLYNVALSDKKRSGNSLNLIIPYEVGDSRIKTIEINQLIDYIEAGI